MAAGRSNSGHRYQHGRRELVATLRREGISNEDVLNAIETVPRHEFIDEAFWSRAYENTALPIGQKQTISQPYVVARMTELALADEHTTKVLEVGTGCGYQTAVLAEIVPEVYSIERIQSLHQTARQRLRRMGYYSLRFLHGDGYAGWDDNAPYEAIIVTAGADEIPDALLSQLAVGGRMVIPVGKGGHQSLKVVRRWDERYTVEDYDAVTFVPLLGGLT